MNEKILARRLAILVYKIEKMALMLTKEDFKKQVMENRNLAIVQFKTGWSGACQIIAPVYEELSNAYESQADFFTVDVENDPTLETEFGIAVVPTILFFRNGKLIDHITGLTPKNNMISKIENALIN